MSSSLTSAAGSDPVRSLDEIRPKAAKAGLASDRIGLSFIAVTTEQIVAHYGSVKATAISLGNVDPSLLMREFKAGNFRLFERADAVAKASVFARVHEVYGPLTTPLARGHRLLDQVIELAHELRQILEHTA